MGLRDYSLSSTIYKPFKHYRIMRTNYVTCPVSEERGIELEIARHRTLDDARAFLERLAKKHGTKVEFENPNEGWEKAFGKKWPYEPACWQWYVEIDGKKYRNYYEPQD